MYAYGDFFKNIFFFHIVKAKLWELLVFGIIHNNYANLQLHLIVVIFYKFSAVEH